jgi:sugar lactone lactonase YvrE
VLDTGDGVYTDVRWVNPVSGIINAYNFQATYPLYGSSPPNDSSPRGIAFDISGNAYYMGENKSKGWKIDYISGGLTQFAGNVTGGSGCSGDDVPALGDGIDNPSGVAPDTMGNLYFVDNKCFRVRRIDSTGVMHELLGNGGGSCGFTAVGTTTSPTVPAGYPYAQPNAKTTGLNTPYAVTVDPFGNVYVANQTCYALMEVLVDPTTVVNGVGYATANSQVIVLAGEEGVNPGGYTYPTTCLNGEPCGLATSTPLEPNGVQIDPEGPVKDSLGEIGYNLYIQEASHVWYYDFATKWLRRIAAGNPNCAFASDTLGDNCPGADSLISTAYGIDVDALGNLYIGDDGDNVIRKIFKGSQFSDGSALWLNAPFVPQYSPGGTPRAFEGAGVAQAHFDPGDSPAETNPFQIFGNFNLLSGLIDGSGTSHSSPDCLENSDTSWDCLFSVDFNATRSGTVTAPLTVTGSATGSIAQYSATGTTSHSATALDPGVVTVLSTSVSNPEGVAVDSLGNWYVADTGNNRILKNGVALVSGLNAPQGVAADGAGNVFFSDTGNNLVKEWNVLTGAVAIVAGGGTPCAVASSVTFNSDSLGNNCLATQATLNHPTAVAVDALRNLYILDQGNAEVRRVDPKKKTITLVDGGGGAGISECAEFYLHPRCATLTSPVALAVGAPGLVYVAEGGSANDIKEINLLSFPATISQVATTSSFTSVSGVGVDAAGSVYYSDAGNQIIGLSYAGTSSSDQLVLGIPGTSGSIAVPLGGSLANAVALNGPAALAVDPSGSIYVADTKNNRILKVDRSQSEIQFGSVAPGSSIISSAVAVTNVGTQPLTLPAVSVSGTNAGDFGVLGTCTTATVAPGSSCQIQALAQPKDTGPLSATMSLAGNAVNESVIQLLAAVGGTVTTTTLSFSPQLDSFGQPTTVIANVTPASCAGQVSFVFNDESIAPIGEQGGTASVAFPWNNDFLNICCGNLSVQANYTDPSGACADSQTAATFSIGNTGVITPVTPAPTLILNCPELTYDGNPHSCTGTAIGSNGVPVAGSWVYSPASEVNTGFYPVTGTFISSDPNYLSGSTASGALSIFPASPTVIISCPTVTYDGNSHSCAGSATGLGGNPVNGAWSFDPAGEINAGTYPLAGWFLSSDPNYLSSGEINGQLIIEQAIPIVTVTCPTVIYDGRSYSCKATAAGAGGAKVTGSFWFNPFSESTVGSYPETVTFYSGNPNYTGASGSATLVIEASATGTVSATFSSTSVTFPTPVPIGESSPAQYLQIMSTGTAPLLVNVGGMTIGANPEDFAVSNQAGTCATPYPLTSLANHESCNLRVIFTPTGLGPRSAVLFIFDNLAGSPQVVYLSGTATSGAQLSLTASTLTFPATNVGTTAATQYLTLKSTGLEPVVISQVAISSGDFDLSDQAGTCTTAATTSLAPGASCNIRVKFHPTATGLRSLTVTINDNTSTSPHTVTLDGTGISSEAQLSLSSTTLTFPATKVGATAGTQYITLKSTGFQPAVISQVVLASGDFDLSDQAGTCTTAASTSLVPGASCNIRVKFHPTATGSRSATVTINDNTPASPHLVTLNGAGQ